MILFLILGFIAAVHGDENWDLIPESVISVPPVYKKSNLPACSGVSSKSCQEIEVKNFAIVNHTVIEFPGVDYFYSDNDYSKVVSGQYFSQSFTADDGSIALVISNFGKRSLSAVVNTADGRYFAIEKSRYGKHVLIEANPEAFEDEVVIGSNVQKRSISETKPIPQEIKEIQFTPQILEPLITVKSDDGSRTLPHRTDQFRREKRQLKEKATVRVAFYYTKGFTEIESDIEGYINFILEQVNLGFRDSGVNIEAVKYKVPKCNRHGEMNHPKDLRDKKYFIRLSTVQETNELKTDAGKLLEEFKRSIEDNFMYHTYSFPEPNYDYDIAILLFPAYEECRGNRKCSCGAVYESNSIHNRQLNVGTVRKDCGKFLFTLGHNIGEMFGGGQNREVQRGKYVNPSFPDYGYAKLLFQERRRCPTDRTIMSYAKCYEKPTKDRKSKRINGYSSPNVCLVASGPKVEVCEQSDTRMRTGDSNSDNVRVFHENVIKHITKSKWTKWSGGILFGDKWSPCSTQPFLSLDETKCGPGIQTKRRYCSPKYFSEDGCEGECKLTKNCEPRKCVPESRVSAACDNNMLFYADGKLVGSTNEYTQPSSFTVPKNTRVLAIKCEDTGGLGGILVSAPFSSDKSWKCTELNKSNGQLYQLKNALNPFGHLLPAAFYHDSVVACDKDSSCTPWNVLGFDDSKWTPAHEIAKNQNSEWGFIKGINGDAKWIWTARDTWRGKHKRVLCRKVIS